jgi:hypothetical protein
MTFRRSSPRDTRHFLLLRVVAAAAMLVVCGAGRADGLDRLVRNGAGSTRAVVARDIAVGRLVGAFLSGGALAYTSGAARGSAQIRTPVLPTGAGVGLLVRFAAGMIGATRRGHDREARPTSDGQSFLDQHPRDVSGAFVAALPAVPF